MSKMSNQNWSRQFSNVNSGAKYVPAEVLAPFSSSSEPTSQIEMTLSCRKLINADILSLSDPYCLVQMKETWQEKYFDFGRTETIDDNLNPEWVKKFIINYNFESVQKMRFEVWDVDPDGQDFLGCFETTLGDIVSYSGRQFVGRLTGVPGKNCGEIIIVTEEVSSCKQIVHMQIRASDLDKKSWLFSNDPFMVISRANEDGSYSVVLKTETLPWTQNPMWRTIVIRATSLCNGDFDRSIKIDCYDSRRNGCHKLIGTCHTSLRALSAGVSEENRYPLVHAEKRRKKSAYSNSGHLELVSIQLIEEVSFLDYIRGGTQMHFAVAIDFTASNRIPTDPQSLHYLDMYQPNSYEIALRSVGEIIEHYDSSKMFAAFGFGAKIPPNGVVSHQFPLNGNPSHPFCAGIQEILTHYRAVLNTVTLYGPTNFSQVINNTSSIASQFQDGKHYFVLLIITDGIISDMHQTKHAVIKASRLPISIIIVGVGNAEFDAMDELDSDDVRLEVDGHYAERDIVQFVPLNKFVSNRGAFVKSQVDLAKEVLEEIPEQMTSFMRSRGFKPGGKSSVPTDPSALPPTAPLKY